MPGPPLGLHRTRRPGRLEEVDPAVQKRCDRSLEVSVARLTARRERYAYPIEGWHGETVRGAIADASPRVDRTRVSAPTRPRLAALRSATALPRRPRAPGFRPAPRRSLAASRRSRVLRRCRGARRWCRRGPRGAALTHRTGSHVGDRAGASPTPS